MKHCFVLFLAGILPIVPSSLNAEHFEAPHVSVYGTATTDVVPDIMNWRINVRTTGKTVADVASLHDRNVADVIRFLQKEEIAEQKTQTSQLQLAEDLEYSGGKRIKKGYYASTTISFESNTIEDYRSLWIGLSQLKNVSINGVSFDTSKRIEIQDQTRIEALKAARAKAKDLAGVLGWQTAGALMIEEEATRNNDSRSVVNNARMSRVAADSGNSGPSLSVGTIPIRMQIKAVFQIIP
ncbi:SIMPL domain-containing protein [Verrucomicrobia bacterium]|jgi:uncharacterized protein|nr:SIMPL domain-containing protein [Verrucomicrobiota bacterium]MDA7657515.1 SIMPL domain-containing protein [Verrucomicrobiota bacterium]